jgi:hypothetical protein
MLSFLATETNEILSPSVLDMTDDQHICQEHNRCVRVGAGLLSWCMFSQLCIQDY